MGMAQRRRQNVHPGAGQGARARPRTPLSAELPLQVPTPGGSFGRGADLADPA